MVRTYNKKVPGKGIRLQLPEISRIAVIGGTKLHHQALSMAAFIGKSIVESDFCLLTGGRVGAGKAAAQGAYEACKKRNLDPAERIYSFVPEKKQPDFDLGTTIHVGNDRTARRVALMAASWSAIVIGGGKGTRSEVLIAVLEAIMDGYSIIPVKGTGGEADRICSRIPPFPNPMLNSSIASQERADAIVETIKQGRCWFCDIKPVEAHYDWFENPEKDRTAEKMYRIRHKYY